MSKIYLELLDEGRKNVFYQLSNFANIGYLAGGTALFLQINHRESFDFDVFISRPITHFFRKKIEEIFGKQTYYVQTGDQISFHTQNEIGITFVRYYYKSIFPLVESPSIMLASPKDIAADKAYTIGRRATWRDYVDLYFLLKLGYVDIEEIITLAVRKFSGEFVKTQFLEQLVYFKDLSISPITYIKEAPTSAEIQSFLGKATKEYLAEVLK